MSCLKRTRDVIRATLLITLGGFFLSSFPSFLAVAYADSATFESTDLAIVFDTSGSMNDPVSGRRKIDIAKDTMWKFIDTLPPKIRVGLVVFDGQCGGVTAAGLKTMSPQSREELKTLIAGLQPGGNTPIGDSLRKATKMLAGSIVLMKKPTKDRINLANRCHIQGPLLVTQ